MKRTTQIKQSSKNFFKTLKHQRGLVSQKSKKISVKIKTFKKSASLPKGKVRTNREKCDHSLHMKCTLCGAAEFAVGLVVGVVLALMFAKAF